MIFYKGCLEWRNATCGPEAVRKIIDSSEITPVVFTSEEECATQMSKPAIPTGQVITEAALILEGK